MNNDPFTPEPSTPPQPFGPQPEAPQQPVNQAAPQMQGAPMDQAPVQQPASQFNQPQQPVAQPQFAPQPQQPMVQPPVGPKKSKKGLIIGGIIGLVVIAAAVIAFLLWQGEDKAPVGDSTGGGKNGSSEQGKGNIDSTGKKNVTTNSTETIDLVKSLASSVYGVSGVIVLIPSASPGTIEVSVAIDSEPLSMTTLNGLLAAIANGAGLSDVTNAKVSFVKGDGSVAAGANLPLAIERTKVGASVVGTASDSSATFDIRKMRELLS